MSHTILLYYKYVPIEDPQAFMQEERARCKELGLKGRIIIAREGLNGTVEGTDENTKRYMDALHADPRFNDMVFKISKGTGNAFPKCSIKVRDEIVSAHLGDDDVDPTQLTGVHLDPDELDRWYDEKRDFVVVDMRNRYEFEVGHFEGSYMPAIDNFRDIANVLPELEPYKEKTIVTVCTGGVRCEKASGYLLKKGFTNVYQLDGGMATYMERHPGKHFKGKLYVFDQRVVMGDGIEDPSRVVGRCRRCEQPAETYVNCKNEDCNLHFICCDGCREADTKAFCSPHCHDHARISVHAC